MTVAGGEFRTILVLLSERLHDQRVFVLTRDGIVLAAASVGDRYIDADPEPPDYSKPPRLRMVASSTPGQAHGRHLVERVRDEVEPDLVHDGCLSDAGARFAERMGLSGEAGVAPSKITDEKAVELANELLMFAAAHPEVEKRF